MIEPILSLAFSIHSNPGVYALLLGSGLSRSASIPTGWEVVIDLIRKLAILEEEDCEPNPISWYKDKFGEDPNYSKILDSIAKSPAERNQLLRSYFEANEEEKEQGLKIPTAAHKSIANLVANKSIKVIITTNFDRLLEKALESLNVTPVVISTPDAIKGALPLTHTDCAVIKVHGDYLDTRIKNTPSELETYDDQLNKLLDRIFDEFGLIVCGWSAEWDTALRVALERCKNHRFSTYWATRSKPKEVTKNLINLRCAKKIIIKDADSFFEELEQKVTALKDLERPHPLSSKVAVASLKRYISDDRHRIQLNDLVMNEANRIFYELSGEQFSLITPENEENYKARIHTYETLTEILRNIFITGCYWGEEKHEDLWVNCLKRVIFPSTVRSGNNFWINLRFYPALLLLYSGGISSIIANRYNNFAALLTKPNYSDFDKNKPLTLLLAPNKVIDKKTAESIFQMERHFTPVSDHLQQILREAFKDYIPEDEQYIRIFDRFEYLFSLVYFDLYKEFRDRSWAPVGCFLWRNRSYPKTHIINKIKEETEKEKDDWPLIKSGLFKGSFERFQQIQNEFNEFFNQIPYLF